MLKHALQFLRKAVAGFFRFLDATERHPFFGAGRLVNYAESIVKIDVQQGSVSFRQRCGRSEHTTEKMDM